MPSSIAQPTNRIVRNYHDDLQSAMDLICGVMMDVQNRAVNDAVHRFVADVPWRQAAEELVQELKPVITSLAITVAPSPSSPLNRLSSGKLRA